MPKKEDCHDKHRHCSGETLQRHKVLFMEIWSRRELRDGNK